MSRFVLNLLPDGKAILTTEDNLSPQQADEIRVAWNHWQENGGVAIVAECRVQRVDSIALELRDGELVPV